MMWAGLTEGPRRRSFRRGGEWFPSETTGGQMGAARLVLPIPPGKHWGDEMPVLPRDSSEKQLPAPRKGRGPRQGEPKRPPKNGALTTGMIGMRFAPVAPAALPAPEEKPKREKKPRRKNDPKLVAAARELRDRWLEHVNSGEMLIESAGKYDVVRATLAIQPDCVGRPHLMLTVAA